MMVTNRSPDRNLWSILGAVVLAGVLIAAADRLFGPGPYAAAAVLLVMAACSLALIREAFARTSRSRLSRALHLIIAASVIPAYGTALYLTLLNPTAVDTSGAGEIAAIHITVTGVAVIMSLLFLERPSQSALGNH